MKELGEGKLITFIRLMEFKSLRKDINCAFLTYFNHITFLLLQINHSLLEFNIPAISINLDVSLWDSKIMF